MLADGSTLLHVAVQQGLTAVASALLHKSPKLTNMQNHAGDTALHLAYRNRFRDQTALLLQCGASEMIENKLGQRPNEY